MIGIIFICKSKMHLVIEVVINKIYIAKTLKNQQKSEVIVLVSKTVNGGSIPSSPAMIVKVLKTLILQRF